jgi:hypothetical protein
LNSQNTEKRATINIFSKELLTTYLLNYEKVPSLKGREPQVIKGSMPIKLDLIVSLKMST